MDIDFGLFEVEAFFGISTRENVDARVKRFKVLYNLSRELFKMVMGEVMKKFPQKIEEMIWNTELDPTMKRYPNEPRAFDHELENFLTCFQMADVHRYPTITRALFDKTVHDTPERFLYGLDFLNNFIESHPNWDKFAEFIFKDLFGGPKIGMLDPAVILKRLSSVNGRWYEIFEKTEENADSIWELRGWEIDPHLGVTQSRRVIDKIRELFF